MNVLQPSFSCKIFIHTTTFQQLGHPKHTPSKYRIAKLKLPFSNLLPNRNLSFAHIKMHFRRRKWPDSLNQAAFDCKNVFIHMPLNLPWQHLSLFSLMAQVNREGKAQDGILINRTLECSCKQAQCHKACCLPIIFSGDMNVLIVNKKKGYLA